jgi:hypothetical protein
MGRRHVQPLTLIHVSDMDQKTSQAEKSGCSSHGELQYVSVRCSVPMGLIGFNLLFFARVGVKEMTLMT